jgi:hypothetical protein
MNLAPWLAVLVLVGGCKKDEDEVPVTVAKTSEPSPFDEVVATATGTGLVYAAVKYMRLPEADRAKKLASRLGPPILAGWDDYASRAKTQATNRGKDRARGKKNRSMYDDMPPMLDEIAPLAPDVAKRWSVLKPELAALEQTAFDADTNDKRPRVVVWSEFHEPPTTEDLYAPEFLECVEAALAKRWPELKFVQEYRKPDGANVQLVVATSSDTYRSNTGQTMKMASGAGIRLVGTALPPTLAKVFARPLEAAGTSRNAGEIKSDLGATPALEASRAAMDAQRTIREEVCADVARQIGGA